jgi:hypothetical protein
VSGSASGPAGERDGPAALFAELAEGVRRSVGAVRAAIETMEAYPDMEPEVEAQFRAIIAEEARRLSALVESAEARFETQEPTGGGAV